MASKELEDLQVVDIVHGEYEMFNSPLLQPPHSQQTNHGVVHSNNIINRQGVYSTPSNKERLVAMKNMRQQPIQLNLEDTMGSVDR